jgi:exonuclease III
MCTLNIRSFTNPLHYTAIADLADTHNIHVFALTETWISHNTTSAQLFDAIPHGFTFISTPRPILDSNTSSIVGGGTAFLIREPCKLLSSPTATFKSFELSTVTIKLPHSNLAVYNIYRPPLSPAKSRHSVPFSQFLEDFQTLISTISTTPHEFVITGDFNIHVDDLTDSNSIQFLSLLDHANLTQHVSFPTHRQSHTLDLVITSANSTLSPTVTFMPVSPTDHFPVISSLNISASPPAPITKCFIRSIRSININHFCLDILSSRLITHPPSELSDLVDCYNSTLSDLLNKHAPLKSKIIRTKAANPWYTPALKKLKLAKRHLERVWSRSHSSEDHKNLRTATNHYHAAIIKAKRAYNSTLISSSLTNPRHLWNNINKILHRSSMPVLPSYESLSSLSQSFATFFSDKIHKLHTTLLSNHTRVSPHVPPPFTPPNFSSFTCVTTDEVSKLLSQSPDTYCDLDPIPTSLLKQFSHILLPTITNIINLSISTGVFPDQFKSCSVHPLLKKSNLDKDNLSNYRPISHLSFLSKLTERVVKLRLVDYLSNNNLLNSFQSAYIKHHSTETALLSVHDHIIRAISHQQVTCLTLLDLSAAFDTIDHSILLERLSSWFGISSTALSWIKSYLLNRSFSVNIENSKSSVFQLLYGVPQGSVLGPLLFILYTTPLSTVISNSSANHHLFADDTQLFLSFSAADFAYNITHLENTISNVSNWMSSNFLSLNPSKTEFLIIGLPQQLSKLNSPIIHLPNNVTLSPVTSARNLGVIFDNNLTFSQHISAISKSCFLNIRDLRRIRNTIDQTTACTIATSLIHSKIDYCNSLLLNLPATQTNRLQLVLNSAARAVTKTPKFHHITPILKSLHWLKINERIQYKVLSLTYKSLQTGHPSYLRSLLSFTPNRSTRSSSLITLNRPTNTSRLRISNRSFSHCAPVLWNNLPPDLRQFSHHLTSSTSTLNSPVSDLSTSLFLKKLKTHLFHFSFPP